MEKELKKKWRKLDNSAKIFPLNESRRYSTVFRYSVILKENVDKKILEKAVDKALNRYKAFKVRMRSGFFWDYFDENPKKPVIEEEYFYPCKKIDPISNHEYLFKVTYFERKINIDVFHSLTDGNGALVFFREIVYNYLEIKHPELMDKEERKARKIEVDTEDSYLANFDKKTKKNKGNPKGYVLKGRELKLGQVSANHLLIDSNDLKKECEKHNLSTTQYLTAVLIYSVYNANIKKYNKSNKKPLKVCIPVNLKKYYKSKTMANFFSYISVDADMETCKSFEKIVDFVRAEFEHKLTEEEILKTMSNNVKIGKNIFISFIPLFLKRIIIRSIYREIQRHLSITYSNVGKVGIIGKYQDYIDYFLVMIAPEYIEKIKCSSCTFKDKIALSFTSILNDNSIEKYYYNYLISNDVKVEVESNEVLESITKNEKKKKEK